jgi:hypothetical protein
MSTALSQPLPDDFMPRVEALTAEDLRPAYALVRLRYPELEFAAWQRIAARALRGKSLSALVAFDSGNHMVGLCLYANVPTLGRDRALVALSTIAADPVDPAAVRTAMQNRLAELARSDAVQVAVAATPAPLRAAGARPVPVL